MRHGPQPCPGGTGIRDGRGYGPYGRGYYHCGPGPDDYAPFGPHCERLPPTPVWDAQHQLGAAPTQDEWNRQRKTYSLVIAGLLGTAGLILAWTFVPKKQYRRTRRRR
jgi:hypothetical protein